MMKKLPNHSCANVNYLLVLKEGFVMGALTRSIAWTVKGSASLVGMMSAGAIAAMPAFADNASVSGAVSYTTPAGYSTSISAEKVAPRGYSFNGTVTVTAVTGTTGTPQGLILDSGTPVAVGTAPNNTMVKDSVIQKLGSLDVKDAKELEAYSAILKAAAGADGLE
jgi:hypothetical protein